MIFSDVSLSSQMGGVFCKKKTIFLVLDNAEGGRAQMLMTQGMFYPR